MQGHLKSIVPFGKVQVPMTLYKNDSLADSLSRRSMLTGIAAAGVATASVRYAAARQSEIPIGVATMPNWEFSVLGFADPYAGEITTPDPIPPGVRVVAFQVVISNKSDMPLDFSSVDVRLRDTEGSEYRAGEYLGTEPRLVSQNLPDGERSRGWVWFGIGPSVQVASIVFVAPPPILRVLIPSS